MLNFCSLYSGSSGNSLFVQSENTKILIDIGVSAKKATLALQSINIQPSDLDGILITHEHSDHVQGLSVFARKYNIPIYVDNQTFDAIKETYKKGIDENLICNITVNKKFLLNDLTIYPFEIPHDAINPCGYTITKGEKKISIATDIGNMTEGILKHLENSCFVLLESNYDPEVLKCASYPYRLKCRIAGPTGHLSNETAGKTLSYLTRYGLTHAMLGHLSQECNFPELAYTTVMNELISTNNEKNFNLSVASRFSCSKLIELD